MSPARSSSGSALVSHVFGGDKAAVLREAILGIPRDVETNANGVFQVTTQIGGRAVTARGRIVDGIARIGTMLVR